MIFKLKNSKYPDAEIDIELVNTKEGCKFNFTVVDSFYDFILEDEEMIEHLKEFSKNILSYMSQMSIQNEAHSNLTPFIFLSEEYGFSSNFEFRRV